MSQCRLLLFFVLVALMPAQSEFPGTLDDALFTPEIPQMAGPFPRETRTPEEIAPFVQQGDLVFRGTIRGRATYLVERTPGAFVLVDADRNGTFDARERHLLAPPSSASHQGVVWLNLPLTKGPFATEPVFVTVYRKQNDPDSRIVGHSPRSFVRGRFALGGREVVALFEFHPGEGIADPSRGWQGFDLDGDGVVSRAGTISEMSFARGAVLVTEVHGHLLSAKHLDLEQRRFILRGHPVSDKQQIVRRTGEEVPDFEFTDLSGKQRRLSEFEGKLVLLDFWATWCAPCRAEIPQLRETYAALAPNGFVILGMNADEDAAALKDFIREENIAWPQASWPSIRDLTQQRFRIDMWPTYVLLDGQRRILEADGAKLRGPELGKTLKLHLPR